LGRAGARLDVYGRVRDARKDKEEGEEDVLGEHGDVDEDLGREPSHGLRARLERVEAVPSAVEPGVVFERVVRRRAARDDGGMRAVEDWVRGRRGEEALEREGEDAGDLGRVDLGLRARLGHQARLMPCSKRRRERTLSV